MTNIDIMRCKLIKESEIQYGKVSSSDDASEIFRLLGIDEEAEEVMWMLCLNSKGHIIGAHQISRGDIASSIVHPREVFKRALLNNATGIIVGHNHPSLDSTPSSADIAVTKRLAKAGEILGIQLIDHIIIGSDSFSLRSAGHLD